TAAGNPAQRSMIDPYRLAAERDPAGLVEQDRTELARDALLSGANQGLFADEVDRLAQADGKTEPGLVWVVLGGDVAAPHPVSLLQSHRINRPVTCGHQAMGATRVPERVPELRPELDRTVQLPSQLADVG